MEQYNRAVPIYNDKDPSRDEEKEQAKSFARGQSTHGPRNTTEPDKNSSTGASPDSKYTDEVLRTYASYIFARVQFILAKHFGPTHPCPKEIAELEERLKL